MNSPSQPAVVRGLLIREMRREDLIALHRQIEDELFAHPAEQHPVTADVNRLMELELIEDELEER